MGDGRSVLSVTQLLDFEMAHQVRILTDYCKGCELCVHACPKGVLEMSDELSAIGVRPARPKADAECAGCTLCYQVCPDAAIEIWETAEI
jgi:2-oxoglutarate ferredoxin oxidoreductase subunit delta